MRDFETYAAHERLERIRSNAARKLTRQQRAQHRRIYRRTSAVFLVLLLCLLSALCGNAFADSAESPQEPQEAAPIKVSSVTSIMSHTEDISQIEVIPYAEPEEQPEQRYSLIIENATVTHYDTCLACCGKTDGITASGRKAVPGYTIAVDPALIELGSIVYVDYGDGKLHEYRADDVGGAITGAHIDVCVSDHQTALELGVREATIYVKE